MKNIKIIKIQDGIVTAKILGEVSPIQMTSSDNRYRIIHAHWVTQGKHSTCSNCGKYRGDWRTESFAYCPHCGAKMDERVVEE